MAKRGSHPAVKSTPQQFEELRQDYAAARASRFRRRRNGIVRTGSGADYHYRSDADYLKVMEYARDMDRNDCIVGQMIDRAVTNTIGPAGPTLDFDTGSTELDEALKARMDDWQSDPEQCDSQGEMPFIDQSELAFRHTLVDGDHFGLPREDGTLQTIEAHLCRTPTKTKRNVVHGILLDDDRRRQEYWFLPEPTDPWQPVQRVRDVTRYPARDEDGNRLVFPLYNPKRVTQTRGVTSLAPCFDISGMFEDINFAKTVQQQVVSCVTILRERGADGLTTAPPGQYGTQTSEELANGLTRIIEELAPGLEVTGRPGEKLRGFSPNVPNAEFFEHVKLLLTLIGINLGVPLVMLLMDASETNFSGWRGAVDQARMGFRRNQRWLRARWFDPVTRWKVKQFLADDERLRRLAERANVDPFAFRWNFPGWPYVEPLKDAQADAFSVERQLISPRRMHARRGEDHDQVTREMVEDNKTKILTALEARDEIKQKYPDESIDFRELLWMNAGAKPMDIPMDSGDASDPKPARDRGARRDNNPPVRDGGGDDGGDG